MTAIAECHNIIDDSILYLFMQQRLFQRGGNIERIIMKRYLDAVALNNAATHRQFLETVIYFVPSFVLGKFHGKLRDGFCAFCF